MTTETGRLGPARRGWRWLNTMGIAVPLIGGVAIVLLAAITWVSPLYHSSQKTDVGAPSSYAIGAPKLYQDKGFWVVKLAEGSIIALYNRDPATGCNLEWRSDFVVLGKKGWFRDACSDSTYDLSGGCFSGPCLIGLNRLTVTTDSNSGDVIVNQADGGRGAVRDDAARPINPGQ